MNDINLLMSRLPLINSKDPADLEPSDIDTLVNLHRHRRTRKASLKFDQGSAALDEILPAPAARIPTGMVRRFTRKAPA